MFQFTSKHLPKIFSFCEKYGSPICKKDSLNWCVNIVEKNSQSQVLSGYLTKVYVINLFEQMETYKDKLPSSLFQLSV